MEKDSTQRDIIRIDCIDDAALNVYSKYSENQLYHIDEPDMGIFIAESPIVIERALDARYLPVSFLVEERQLNTSAVAKIISRCERIPVYVADFAVLKELTGFPMTRGMLAAMRRRVLPSMEEICRDAKRIAILEDVVNPTNVGAIVRSAAALKVDGILFTSSCADPLYRRAIRVSMGNIFQIPWTILHKRIDWPEEGFKRLHEMGFAISAMALTDESVPIDDPYVMKEEKLAIVLGTEGQGLKQQTIEKSDYTIRIPMSNGVDSLNVAAASAVAFWQLCHNQRGEDEGSKIKL